MKHRKVRTHKSQYTYLCAFGYIDIDRIQCFQYFIRVHTNADCRKVFLYDEIILLIEIAFFYVDQPVQLVKILTLYVPPGPFAFTKLQFINWHVQSKFISVKRCRCETILSILKIIIIVPFLRSAASSSHCDRYGRHVCACATKR